MAWYGRPSTGFVDLTADLLEAKLPANAVTLPRSFPALAAPSPDQAKLFKIAQLIKSASSPLVVIGKGCAYARAESVVRKLIDSTQLPFLPTPMGKGVVPDSHPCNVSSARSTALLHADVVLVLGAKLNWILHFGAAPKWNVSARIIQVDIDPDVIGQNAGDLELGMVADVNSFTQQLLSHLGSWQFPANSHFRERLSEAKSRHERQLAKAAHIKTEPLKFEHAYHVIRNTLNSFSPPSDGGIIYISEGARTYVSPYTICYETPALSTTAW